MSLKLLWSGLTLLVALPPFLGVLHVSGAETFSLVGSVVMVIGAVLLLLDK